MDFSTINFLAVGVAALSGFVVGGLWYGPLFGKRWMAESGMTEEKIKEGNMGMIYGTTFVLNVIVAIVMSLFLTAISGADAGLMEGIYLGLHVGIGFVATAIGINYLFSQNSMALYLINAGYMVVIFTVIGAVVGVF